MGSEQASLRLNDDLLYKGNVVNNKPNGHGTIYYKNEPLIQATFLGQNLEKAHVNRQKYTYKGQLSKGKFQGKGQLIKDKEIIFDGIFENGILISGTIEKKNEYIYHVNENKSPKLTGSIKFRDYQTKVEIQGEFKEGEITGNGTYKFPNNDKYEGKFSKGHFQGEGNYTSSSFELNGNFSNSVPNGNCTIKFDNGHTYEGQIKNFEFTGQGKYTYQDGTTYQGQFYVNTLTGDCKIMYGSGDISSYMGEVKDGMFNGLGVLEYKNGIIYKGYFLQNRKNGPGVIIYGRKKYKCLYIMDNLIGKISIIS